MWTISTLKAKHLSRWHRWTNRRQDSRCLILWENPILGISKWAIATLLTKMMGFLQWSSDKPCDKPWDFAVSYFQTCRNVHLRQATIQLLRAHGAQWWPTVHMARNDKKCRNANEVSKPPEFTVFRALDVSYFYHSSHVWFVSVENHSVWHHQKKNQEVIVTGAHVRYEKIWPFVRRTWCWKMDIDGIVR